MVLINYNYISLPYRYCLMIWEWIAYFMETGQRREDILKQSSE